MKFDVFISYSRKDSEVVDYICSCLKEHNISYFIDREDISGGEEFSPVIAEHIEQSTLFLFIGSKNSYASKWTSKELHYALNHKENDAILPYLIDEEPLPQKIEFAVADLNVRNIKNHPIDTTLINDLISAKEKFAPQKGKGDLKLAKQMSSLIAESANDKLYCFEILNELGDFNWKSRFSISMPKVAKIYYTKALELLPHIGKGKIRSAERQSGQLKEKLADIDFELENFAGAETLYDEAANDYQKSESRLYRNEKRLECLLKLAEVRFLLEKYELAEKDCFEAKKLLVDYSRGFRLSQTAIRLVEIFVKTLKEQGKNSEAEGIQDEVLSLFRNQERERGESFSDMLVAFAEANINAEQLDNAEKYYREAAAIDNSNIAIMLGLADVYNSEGKYPEAKEAYERVFAIAVDKSITQDSRRDVNIEKVTDKITTFYDKCQDVDACDRIFQLAIAKFRVENYINNSRSPRIGNIYEMYADWLMKQKRYNESLTYLTECWNITDKLATPANIPYARFKIITKKAEIYGLLNLAEVSQEHIKKALEVHVASNEVTPKWMEFFADTIQNFKEKGLTTIAETVKTHFIQSFKGYTVKDEGRQASFYTDFGWFLLLLDEYQEAQEPLESAYEIYRKIKEAPGEFANAKNNLGRLYIHLGKYDEANTLINEALNYYAVQSKKNKEFTHNYGESLSYLGLLNMTIGNYKAAVILFEQSLVQYKTYRKRSNRYIKDEQEVKLWNEQAKAQERT